MPAQKSILNARQRACYVHRASVWRVVADSEAENQYVAVYVAEPCHYTFTDNIDDPSVAGGIKRPTEFTRDAVSFAANLTIADGDYIVNETPGDPLRGQVHSIQGAPHVAKGGGHRDVNKQKLLLMVVPHPPSVITVSL